MTARIGFVGAGNRAQAHYRSLSAMPEAELAATCDVDAERREEAAERYGIPEAFGDYGRMLDALDLDAVYAVMNERLLAPIVTDVLERGENLFIEKPPGVAAEQAERWAELAERSGAHTCVGFQRRFNPFVAEARRRIEERGGVGYGVATFHKHKLENARNDLLHDVIHVVDLLTWMGDGVRDVHGVYGQAFADPEGFEQFHANQFAGILEFAGGGLGLLNANRTAGGRVLSFEMHGEGISAYGEIHGDAGTDELLVQTGGEGYGEAERLTAGDLLEEREPETRIDGTYQLNRHFVECVREDRRPGPTIGDTVASMRTMEGLLEGRRVPTWLA